jgi:CRP/FNR family transcriptional regulator, cyclic AMP receptor protein
MSAYACQRTTVHRDVQSELMASGIFEKTDPQVVAELAKSVQRLCFPSRHVVFRQGDADSRIYLIATGKVKVVHRRDDERELLINVVGPRDIFGEVAAFDHEPREFTAITITEVCAIALDSDEFIAWLTAYPEIGHQILRLLARRLNVISSCLVDVLLEEPAHRLAKRILLLAKRFGTREGDVVCVEHDLTMRELAQFAGVAPDRISATLRDLENRGWIRLEGQRIDIMDAHGLAAFPAASESCVERLVGWRPTS